MNVLDIDLLEWVEPEMRRLYELVHECIESEFWAQLLWYANHKSQSREN